jgi:putative ABC transport system permease protein
MIFFKLIHEAMMMALNELRVNRLRSVLSLLGITVGIFSIISIFTAVDSLKKNVNDSIEEFGTNTLYVQKWPWTWGKDYPWWKYLKRVAPGWKEFRILHEKVEGAAAVAIQMDAGGRTLRYDRFEVDDVGLFSASHDFAGVNNMDFASGRWFSSNESHRGSQVAIVGSDVASYLFPPGLDPIGKMIKMSGLNFKVIGVLERAGESILDNGMDNNVIVPFNYIRKVVNIRSRRYGGQIQISLKAHDHVALEELKDEIRGVMRATRKLKPKEEDDFAINEMTMLTAQTDIMFAVLNGAGWIIGLIAILVGGFGIANIMFVSVRERTNIIGIKKALGARRYVILLEFLLESIVLCLIGGVMGLILVLLLTLGTNSSLEDFTFYLSGGNIMLGLIVSACIGIIAGFVPALTASRMDPVSAIRFK